MVVVKTRVLCGSRIVHCGYRYRNLYGVYVCLLPDRSCKYIEMVPPIRRGDYEALFR